MKGSDHRRSPRLRPRENSTPRCSIESVGAANQQAASVPARPVSCLKLCMSQSQTADAAMQPVASIAAALHTPGKQQPRRTSRCAKQFTIVGGLERSSASLARNGVSFNFANARKSCFERYVSGDKAAPKLDIPAYPAMRREPLWNGLRRVPNSELESGRLSSFDRSHAVYARLRSR